MTRVLVISPQFPPWGHVGGAEISAYHTCRGVQARGVSCTVLAVNNRCAQAVDDRYSFDAISVRRVGFSSRRRTHLRDTFDPRVYKVVREEIRRVRPDVVHMHHASGSSLAPYAASRAERVPVVSTLHDLWLLCPNNMLYRSDGTFCDPRIYPRRCANCFRRYDYWGAIPWRRTVFAALTSAVKAFISPSQAIIDRHVEAGYARNRFRLIRLGFEPQNQRTLRHWGVQLASRAEDTRSRTVVFAGGGTVIKGAQVLLDALPSLVRRIENLRVVIAGGGDTEVLNRFRAYAPVVQVLGSLPFSDMRALFGTADLTLVPSVCHENSPVVIFENYQVGTPVIGSRFGGIPELVREDQTGYLFPPGDAEGLVEAVLKHFGSPPHVRRQMRQACYRYVTTELSLASHVESMVSTYAEVR